jgi:glycosyltransferase involved in cell wall biosynthesis
LFVADSPEEFVKQVEAALDPEFRRKIRENAATVRQMLSWDARLEKMEALIVQASAAADMPAFVSALEH